MTPLEAIQSVFRRYSDFSGRARRAEYWWWTLFVLIVSVVLSGVTVLELIVSAVLFLPGLAVTVRRLHDTGRSGWFVALPYGGFALFVLGQQIGGGILTPVGSLIMLGGAVLVLVWACMDGTRGPNAYGADPKAGER